MLIVTLPSLPGYDIRRTLGPVMAEVIPQQPNVAESYKMAFNALNGSSPFDYQAMRAQGMQELVSQAAQRGANAVLGLSFNMMQVYGTAALVQPISGDAILQYEELVRAGQVPAVGGYKTFRR